MGELALFLVSKSKNNNQKLANRGPEIRQDEKDSIDRTFSLSSPRAPEQKSSPQPSPTFIIKQAGNI